MDDGYIKIHRFTNNLGRLERLEYEWCGNPITSVSLRVIYCGDALCLDGYKFIQIGPYKLKCIEEYTGQFELRYIRYDYPLWFLYIFWHKFNRVLDLFYRRCIITLAVWNLADFNAGAIPSIKDIYLFQWFQQIMKKEYK